MCPYWINTYVSASSATTRTQVILGHIRLHAIFQRKGLRLNVLLRYFIYNFNHMVCLCDERDGPTPSSAVLRYLFRGSPVVVGRGQTQTHREERPPQKSTSITIRLFATATCLLALSGLRSFLPRRFSPRRSSLVSSSRRVPSSSLILFLLNAGAVYTCF